MSCSARLSGLHWASLRILRSRTMTVSSLGNSLIRGIASSSSSDESEEDVVVGKIREEESRLVPSGGSVAARGQKDTASETYADSSGAVQVEVCTDILRNTFSLICSLVRMESATTPPA